MVKTLKMMKPVTFFIALLLALCLTGCQKEAPYDGQTDGAFRLTGHVLSGSAASQVRIEVFSDLQCPACGELFLRILQPLMREYQDRVNVIYHEFPLSGHQFSRPAARFVAAAAKLGQQKVLPVYDAIYSDQAYWIRDGNLEASVARALSGDDFLRVRQILRDADSLAEINENIERDLLLGMRKGVNVTPTMFISYGSREQKVEGVPTYQVIKQFLDPLVK